MNAPRGPSGADAGDGRTSPDLLVVVPTYDEAGTLPTLVSALRDHVSGAHILVVDDASPDGTGTLAEALADGDDHVHVLHRPAKLGLGSAYRDGFRWGLHGRYRYLAAMDADLSHDPASLPALIHALQGADVAVGSRYVRGGSVGAWSAARRALSRSANAYVRTLTGMPLHDATSGYRAFRREVLEAIDIDRSRSEGYAFQIESALRAHRSGFHLTEVPIHFQERRAGRSKLSRRVVLEAAWRVPVWSVPRARRGTPNPRSVTADTGRR